MTPNLQLVLIALGVLLTKHYLCDFVLQTPYQARNKGIYGHPGGIIHSGLHALTSLFVYFVIPATMSLALTILVVEFVLHYHIDWTKEQILKRKGWPQPSPKFWWTLGFDQLLHQFTYLGMVGVLAATRGF